MNKKNQIKKGLVIGVLLLFITTSVVPTINGDNDIHRYSNNSMNLQKYFIGCQGDEWNKTYGGSHKDHGNAGQQTSDGGYIITGETFSYGPGHYDVWLIKTDLYGNEEWNTTFGGDQSDGGFSVCQTTDGGYIVAGYTNSFSIPVATPDILLIKTDDLGNEEWMKTYGGHQYESTRCVQQTTDEGYILFGYTSSYGAGNGDCWLIKTDENGNVTWDKTYGGSEPDACYSGHQTLDNGYILVGFTGSYGVENDIWLIKTDENGDEEWNKTFGENDYDEGISVHQTTDLGYIITGTTSSYAAQKSDVILIKTDADGNEDWHTLYGTSSWDHGNSVQQTIDGGYIITGSMWAGSSDNYDVFLLETDNNGNVSWNQTFGGSNIDRGYSVEQTTDEGYAIVGWNNFSNNGECDVWLIKVAPFENNPPEKPDQPEGPYSGKPETIYSFTGSAVDLNGDQLYYKWDWGDSSTSGWLGPFNSGDPCEISHSWDISGNYEIKMKARDTYWAEGMWSDPLIIEISQEPPNTPTITGPVEGIAGEEYNYTFKSLDPEGNNVFFYIEWGDGDFSDWVGPYHSGETCTLSHTWTDKGSYEIRVKAKDIYGAESNWSVPLGIYRTELTLNIKNNFVSITAEIENTGDYQLNDVDWSFSVTGGILKWINKQQSDTILVLPAGGKEAISSGLIFGLGRITVTVTALDESLTANGLIIGPFIFI